jgi:hypothetical protein
MYRLMAFALTLSAATAVLVAAGQPEPGQESAKGFMRLKLTHSQEILEGIVLEDFKEVRLHAEQLMLLSLDVNWQVLQTPDFVRHSKDFRRAADLLAESADKENVEATLLAYFRLTQNCIDCHRHTRSQPKHQ